MECRVCACVHTRMVRLECTLRDETLVCVGCAELLARCPINACGREIVRRAHKRGSSKNNNVEGLSASLSPSSTLPIPISEHLKCPLSNMTPIADPVRCEDGVTYERSAILDWLARSGESPIVPGVRLDAARLRLKKKVNSMDTNDKTEYEIWRKIQFIFIC